MSKQQMEFQFCIVPVLSGDEQRFQTIDNLKKEVPDEDEIQEVAGGISLAGHDLYEPRSRWAGRAAAGRRY
jgi:hypothetical protein